MKWVIFAAGFAMLEKLLIVWLQKQWINKRKCFSDLCRIYGKKQLQLCPTVIEL